MDIDPFFFHHHFLQLLNLVAVYFRVIILMFHFMKDTDYHDAASWHELVSFQHNWVVRCGVS